MVTEINWGLGKTTNPTSNIKEHKIPQRPNDYPSCTMTKYFDARKGKKC